MRSYIRRTLAQTLTICALSMGALTTLEIAKPSGLAFALTQQEVASRLSIVPTFVIGVGENFVTYPVTQNGDEASTSEVLPVFMTRQDAEAYIERSRTREDLPALPAEATVLGSRLDYLYTLETSSRGDGDRPINLAYIPQPSEVQQAVAINSEFSQGVPLFYPQLEDGTIVAVAQSDGEEIFPLFFSKADLEGVLAELNERDADARSVLQIGVVPLEFMLRQMATSEDDAFSQFRLFPASEVINSFQQPTP